MPQDPLEESDEGQPKMLRVALTAAAAEAAAEMKMENGKRLK